MDEEEVGALAGLEAAAVGEGEHAGGHGGGGGEGLGGGEAGADEELEFVVEGRAVEGAGVGGVGAGEDRHAGRVELADGGEGGVAGGAASA
jgi:hypothetical protein